jgi:hypothetical protein
VHGLAGSAASTWRRMMSVCESDPDLAGYTLDYFTYPSGFVHFPLMVRFASLQDLARGLKTELETHHGDRRNITLVGHSLGGLVVRQYVVSELKAGRTPLASKLLLYAVPNTGASLADVATLVSWNHRHLKQLCKNSDILDILNEDWTSQKVEDRLLVRYVVGGADSVVTLESARPYYGRDNVSTLIGHDHKTIVQAESVDDTRYAILKKIVMNSSDRGHGIIVPDESRRKAADPLFDIYNAQDEVYYLPRSTDGITKSVMSAGHIWVSGPSGVGKTTSLRYCALSSGWSFHQIMLAGYNGRDSLGLLRGMCAELADINNSAEHPNAGSDVGQLIGFFRRNLKSLSETGVTTILIEEIPIRGGKEFSEFMRLLLQLLLAVSSDPSLSGRIQLAFSSISDVSAELGDGLTKLRERIHFMKYGLWSTNEVVNLIDMLCSVLRPELTDAERSQIAKYANGSPRFVKMVFRRWRNNTSGEFSLSELLGSVKAEQV